MAVIYGLYSGWGGKLGEQLQMGLSALTAVAVASSLMLSVLPTAPKKTA